VRCSACDSATPEGSRFCPFCGRPLVDLEATRLSPADSGDPAETVASVQSFGGARSVSAIAGAATFQIRDAPLAPGAALAGRYQIVRQLGRGGMGVVYQADDLRLGHPVALKFLPAALALDAHRLAQFHNEVSVARQVSHPNVCRVYDIGDVDGQLFLSMEYVDGLDLSAHLAARGAFAEEAAVDVIRGICAGLAAVHARGVLHRDLKPANIMMTASGQPKLMDFGIAAAAGENRGEDRGERYSEGTPAYMAPEQLAGADATTRSDIYALGLVMFEMLTGSRVVSAGTLDELTRQQQTLASEVSARLPHASPRLRQAIAQCLERDPAARPASAHEVSALLQTVVLDARATVRRWFQIAVQTAAVPLTFLGGSMVLRENAGSPIVGALMLLTMAVLAAIELRYPLEWRTVYKGHTIRFRNHPVFGERLYVDDQLVDRGRFGTNVTLRGTIERGAGAGERLTAHIRCTHSSLSCRIVAESFAAGA
jgi:Protein kinase domain